MCCLSHPRLSEKSEQAKHGFDRDPCRHGVLGTVVSCDKLPAAHGFHCALIQPKTDALHDADFLRSIEYLIAREGMDGVVNIASPNPLPNREFMKALRQAWGTRIGLPAASWMLEIGTVFLRTETELVLKSRRVIPGRLEDAGFQFQFPQWSAAAQNLVDRWRAVKSAKS